MRSSAITLALTTTALASSVLTAQRKDCGETRQPKHLPTVSAIVDSAAALAELTDFDSVRTDMRFSLLFEDSDSFPHVRPLGDTDPTTAMLLLRSILPQKRGDTWAVRVHVSAGPSPSLTLERSIYCPPSPQNASAAPTSIVFQRVGGDGLPGPGSQRMRIGFEAIVDEGGLPVNVRITQSSGSEYLDNEILGESAGWRFHPALIDGHPIRALYRNDGQSPRM